MLGQDLLGDEDAAGSHSALGDHALAFAKEVGKDAGVADLDRLGIVGDIEDHR